MLSIYVVKLPRLRKCATFDVGCLSVSKPIFFFNRFFDSDSSRIKMNYYYVNKSYSSRTVYCLQLCVYCIYKNVVFFFQSVSIHGDRRKCDFSRHYYFGVFCYQQITVHVMRCDVILNQIGL